MMTDRIGMRLEKEKNAPKTFFLNFCSRTRRPRKIRRNSTTRSGSSVVYSYCTSEGICSHFVSASSLHRPHRRSSLNDSFIIDNQLWMFERLHRIDWIDRLPYVPFPDGNSFALNDKSFSTPSILFRAYKSRHASTMRQIEDETKAQACGCTICCNCFARCAMRLLPSLSSPEALARTNANSEE